MKYSENIFCMLDMLFEPKDFYFQSFYFSFHMIIKSAFLDSSPISHPLFRFLHSLSMYARVYFTNLSKKHVPNAVADSEIHFPFSCYISLYYIHAKASNPYYYVT
jgi:hypothetical protein